MRKEEKEASKGHTSSCASVSRSFLQSRPLPPSSPQESPTKALENRSQDTSDTQDQVSESQDSLDSFLFLLRCICSKIPHSTVRLTTLCRRLSLEEPAYLPAQARGMHSITINPPPLCIVQTPLSKSFPTNPPIRFRTPPTIVSPLCLSASVLYHTSAAAAGLGIQ